MILEARQLTVRRGGADVVRDLSLVARPGEMLGLIGPNGAGKTSLLRALCGLDPVSEGTVLLDGQPTLDLGARRLGRTVSYLAQSGRIHWPLRVEEVVALGRLPHGESTVDAAVTRAMAAADILHLRARTTGALSGGERARVLLARALAVEAPILLVDEPVASLDPYHQLEVMEVLRATARGGVAVVAVLHDLTLAARFCDRLLLMAKGQSLAEGEPAYVLDPERVRRAYGVSVETGQRHGEPFILPWRRCPSPPENGNNP